MKFFSPVCAFDKKGIINTTKSILFIAFFLRVKSWIPCMHKLLLNLLISLLESQQRYQALESHLAGNAAVKKFFVKSRVVGEHGQQARLDNADILINGAVYAF